MQKLIFTYHWGSEPCSGTTHIPFTYESKDKFVFDVLDTYKNHPWEYYGDGKNDYDTSRVTLFDGVYLTKYELESIEKSLYTLEEYFNNNKEEIVWGE